MMRMAGITMKTTVRVDELLATLRKNLETHASLVAEARVGYVDAARKALEARLASLRDGKVVALSFALYPPKDHTEVYKSAIKMLEWTTDPTVTLGADEFRQLVEDEWSWSGDFYLHNAKFSGRTRTEALSKGYRPDDLGDGDACGSAPR